MVTRKDIPNAWVFLRTRNHSISDEVLDFIKDAALEKLKTDKKEYDKGFQDGIYFARNNTEPI